MLQDEMSTSNLPNDTYSNKNDTIHNTHLGNYGLITITSANMIISIVCLRFILLKLTLNRFIKAIFCIMAAQNLVGSTLMTIANAVMIILDERSFITCNILTQVLLIFTRTNTMMPPFIAILRYAMAWKASHARFLKEKFIIRAISLSTIIPYLNLLFNLALNGGYGKLTMLCLDMTPKNKELKVLYPLWAINGILNFFPLVIGIFFDIKMVLFVRNRNRIQPLQLAMIPWKSVNPKDEKEKDIQVPLKATIASSLFFVASLIIYYFFISWNNIWCILWITSAYFTLILPFLLLVTIKQKSSKKLHIMPPTTLQFHNEDLSTGISHPLQFHEDFHLNGEGRPKRDSVQFNVSKEEVSIEHYKHSNITVHTNKNIVIQREKQTNAFQNPKQLFGKTDKVSPNDMQELNASKLLLPSMLNDISKNPQEEKTHPHLAVIDV